MGCGESKHAIATENTIGKSKRSNSRQKVQEKATTRDDVLISNTKQEESGNVVAESGSGNNAGNVSGGDNVKVDRVLEKQGDGSLKNGDVKESDDQPPKGASVVENVKDGDKEASPADAAGDGKVKEAEKIDQVLEKQGEQNENPNVKESDDQPKGEPVVENVKADGDKKAAPAAAKSVLEEAREGEGKKEVKEESLIKSHEEGGAKDQEDVKLPQPDVAKTGATEEKKYLDEAEGGAQKQEDPKLSQHDVAKTGASEEKKDSYEAVKGKESEKEIESDAKNDQALEDQKEVNETGEAETVQSAEAKDSAHNAEEKIPSAKEESGIESAEAGKKAD